MRTITSTIIAGTLLLVMNNSIFAGTRDAQWQAVDEAVRKGLPRTAITNLEPIIAAATREKAYAEAVKAIGKKITLETQIEGNHPDEAVRRLQTEVGKAPAEIKPVLHALLGHWYWNYFQRYRWQFIQRTTTAQAPGKDFTTWDLARLFAEIDKEFQLSLVAEKTLKTTPVSAWDDLLQKGTMPDSHRPTLYDFLAHEALDFYTTGEQAGAKPEDSFELSASSPIFDEPGAFTQWQPPSTDTNSVTLRAIRLYQDLLKFHKNDPAPQLAFADADLDRLEWAGNAAFGEEKNSRYKAALERFIRTHADSEISAIAYERQARVMQQEGDLVAAHKLAAKGAELYPDSPGGKLCQNLVTEIEGKSAAIATEHVWNCFGNDPGTNGPCPQITVTYRNVEMVYFRAIPYAWETVLDKGFDDPANLNQQERQELIKRAPVLEWSHPLPATTDYQERSLTVPAPVKLTPGFYFIVSSHNPEFTESQNTVSLATVWVNDLALVVESQEGYLGGFVLDANTGEPIAGAKVAVWHRSNQGKRVTDPELTTDQNGQFRMSVDNNLSYLFRATHNGKSIASHSAFWSPGRYRRDRRPNARTVFFTDRALYRPGQTIQFKGICLWSDTEKDNYEPLKREELTVIFRDVNGKDIAQQKVRANDFGSFAGSFTAPRDRLMGQMSLVASGRAEGMVSFRVEEYKRPKFVVKLDAPKTAPRLNERVSVTGTATSYTGAAVDGAQVKFRVTRQVQWPVWRWWRPLPAGEAQEIAHGTLQTGTDGTFKIEFAAKPDPAALEKDDPSFTFQMHADVTDSAGETRSAERGVRVGYTMLEANISADEWQTDDKPVVLSLDIKTLDGEPQLAEGSLKIYRLKAPETVQRSSLEGEVRPYWQRIQARGRLGTQPSEKPEDLSDAKQWPLGAVASEKGFTTDTNGSAKVSFNLPVGAYRAVLETQDRLGKKVSFELTILVLSPDAQKLAIKIPHLFRAAAWTLQPGEEFAGLWGSGYESARAFVRILRRGEILSSYWTEPGRTQQRVRLSVTERLRGGFMVQVLQVRENRLYTDSRRIDVPWKDKELDLTWEHFVSKLQPGAKETWSLAIQPTQNDGEKTRKEIAELVATLYDESLDAYTAHNWMTRLNCFGSDYSLPIQAQFGNMAEHFRSVVGGWSRPWQNVQITYRSFPPDLVQGQMGGRNLFRTRYASSANFFSYDGNAFYRNLASAEVPMARGGLVQEKLPTLGDTPTLGRAVAFADYDSDAAAGLYTRPGASPGRANLDQISARKNLNETAFFFPQLTSDSNGVVRLTFTMPEALTKWRFMGFAHDRSLRSGYLEDHAVTAKDLMVQPNPPRFLREGDTVEFTVKVTNQSDQRQAGTVRLNFRQALDDSPADKLLGVAAVSGNRDSAARTEQPFDVPAKESRSYSWRIAVPDGCGFLTYKTVGASATISDGEEGAIPVLSRRILVTESLPLPIRGPATKNFEFTKLLKSGSSKTLRNESLTVQMVSNPAWYAVLALPYLIEYPYECSEQIFNRLYANALARNIANSDPKIRRIFDQWKNTPALDSPLEKNQDLKSVVLEETPWVRQAAAESQARRNVGVLFDENRLNSEMDATLRKLIDMQLQDGRWPWFPGGPANEYITLYIVTGFGRMRHLGVDVDVQPAVRALQGLDAWMDEHYRHIQERAEPEKYVPSSTDALYLYGRSFFLKDMPIAGQYKTAVDFFLKQARKFWLETRCRQTEGHVALALFRFNSFNKGNDTTPAGIMRSLKERSVANEEMGMFWRDTELSWWWYRAPIETQALMIEAFDEVAGDKQAVEDCRVWLLKQKQTQDWKTTKATADAVYALLLRGRDILSSSALVQLKLDGIDVTPQVGAAAEGKKRASKAPEPTKGKESRPAPEPGTGFYEIRFSPSEIKPKLGNITVKKVDQGVAWGSVHWQYLEDMSKVTPHEGTPLKLKKSLYTKTATQRGPVLEPVKGEVKVGDEVVVRIELRTDRDMEYIHMKDQRGSGTEPVNVLSQYRYQDGLAYYESTRDTASHFFMDYLPKGTYVFEYSTRVQLRGRYQTGVAEIQCMYAPEFNSHSESIPLSVQ